MEKANRYDILFIVNVVTVSSPQMKKSTNDTSFPQR